MPDLKTLEQLQEELMPEGDKVDKDEIIGLPLAIQRVKAWKNKHGKMVVRVTATTPDGELIWFNGGEPMHDQVIPMKDHVPFLASVVKLSTAQGDNFYLLE